MENSDNLDVLKNVKNFLWNEDILIFFLHTFVWILVLVL